jgi:LmbE family N-acetylglucosaminyl deacetylase
MFTYNDIFSNKQRVLFVTAHPDDVLVFFAALIHQLRQDQKEVFVLLVTNGARGSRDNAVSEAELATQRLSEEIDALKILGVDEAHFACLGYADGEVESNMKLIGEISKYIRKFKADLVATHEPSLQYLQSYDKTGYFVQHRDHRKIGEAVIDAVYPFSRDRSFFTEHYAEGIEPHEVFDILLTDEKECNFDFDLTENIEIKKQAMRAHQTQFNEETITEILDIFTFNGRTLEKFHYVKLLW